MKVMIIHIGETPETQDIDMEYVAEMTRFNEEISKEITIIEATGLRNSRHGKRVRFMKGRQVVVDGPFTEAKELVAGFSIWEVDSLDQAAEIVKRMPMPEGVEADIEIREVFTWD